MSNSIIAIGAVLMTGLVAVAASDILDSKYVRALTEPPPLEIRIVAVDDGVRLNISVKNIHSKPYLLRELMCTPSVGSDKATSTVHIKVEQTIRPKETIQLGANVEPSLANYVCEQIGFELLST